MALVLKNMYRYYNYVLYDLKDPSKADSWMTSPKALCCFYVIYWLTVMKIGPEFMKNRPPYNIKKILIVYNILQIILNLTVFYGCISQYFESDFWFCVNFSQKKMDELILLFYLIKLIDCSETLFFVLRKSYRQVNFLHIYHHAGMVFALWIAHGYNLGPTILFVGLLNSFVHCYMYCYYLLAILESKLKYNLAIKKSVTQIQIIQFILYMFIYAINNFDKKCEHSLPRPIAYLFFIQNFFMVSLFGEFYFKTYMKKGKTKI